MTPPPDHSSRRAGGAGGASAPDLQADLCCAIACTVPVLITGADDLAYRLARDIHERSARSCEPFIAVDCARVTAFDLHRVFEQVEPQGVAFLRTIDRLAASLQRKLNECLCSSSARVIASSSAPLLEQVERGVFDEVLFYRLNQIHLVAEPQPGSLQPRRRG
jgi:DNA-binding NtrC family response regulator